MNSTHTMTNAERHRLVERYVAFLAEGHLDLLRPILDAAEHDNALAELIVEVTDGYAEDTGFSLNSDEDARMHARILKALLSEDEGTRLTTVSRTVKPASSGTLEGAEGRTFLVVTRDISGKTMKQATEALGGSVAFFDDLNRYPNHPDPRVRALHPRIYELNAERNDVPFHISADAMENNNPLSGLAAYAEEEIDHSVPTFEEILEDSDMTSEQQAYWRAEAERLLREASQYGK